MSQALLKKPQNEMESVFGQVEIENYTIKPWTISQLVNLSPVLKYLAEALKKEGLNLDQTDIDTLGKKLSEEISIADMADYLVKGIEIIGPVIPRIIAVSARIEVDEAENIEWGLALALMSKIIAFNWEHIKNWLGQILGKDPKTLFLALQKPTT